MRQWLNDFQSIPAALRHKPTRAGTRSGRPGIGYTAVVHDNPARRAHMPIQHSAANFRWLRHGIAVFCLLAAFPAICATLVLYEQENFRGASFVAEQSISNFAN